MLTDGIDHVATITNDGDRLIDFYAEVFDGTVEADGPDYPGGPRMIILNLGPNTELNVFEVEGNMQADHQRPMFGRGRLDHIGFHAADLERFEEIRRRLMAKGATDGVVTEFDPSLFVKGFSSGLAGRVELAPSTAAGIGRIVVGGPGVAGPKRRCSGFSRPRRI